VYRRPAAFHDRARPAGGYAAVDPMDGVRSVLLLGFPARVEREVVAGVAYVRIDDEGSAGQTRRAHAAFEERLATQEPFDGDLAPSGRLRVAGLMHDTDRRVLRVKVEVVESGSP